MKTFTSYLGLVTLLGLATSCLAANIDTWEYCDDSEDPPASCTIQDLDVEPCREAAHGGACRLRRGHSAGIRYHFTPNFSGESLQTRAYWESLMGDLPFLGMNTNACDSTPCPITAGTQQLFNYSLPIADSYPSGSYTVKWKLWNAQEEECCFKFDIILSN